jgi:hypothetical protein
LIGCVCNDLIWKWIQQNSSIKPLVVSEIRESATLNSGAVAKTFCFVMNVNYIISITDILALLEI